MRTPRNTANRLPQQRFQIRYGIGEWYGKSFLALSDQERRDLARIQSVAKKARPKQICPFQSFESKVICTKDGGVCSLRLYEKPALSAEARAAGPLVTTCPRRFEEEGAIYEWVGETLIITS